MKFKKLHPDAQLPTRQKDGDAGYDLHCVQSGPVHAVSIFDTGVAVEIPPGHVGLIRDRSGLATNKGITVLAGVVDSGYRGEIKVALSCTKMDAPVMIIGERIAQLVVVPCIMESSEWVDELSQTERGAAGFGSTG